MPHIKNLNKEIEIRAERLRNGQEVMPTLPNTEVFYSAEIAQRGAEF